MKPFAFNQSTMTRTQISRFDRWKRNVKKTLEDTQSISVEIEYSDEDFENYYTLIHKFGLADQYVKSKDRDHLRYLNMVKGLFFDEQTVQDMEIPLINRIDRLLSLLSKSPRKQAAVATKVSQMLMWMQQLRTREGTSTLE
jgi:hypothetical protein